MRALFRPFALHAAYTPIETIVFFCILGTLAYFHILSAIKNSYDKPTTTGLALQLPAYATLLGDEWVGVREAVWNKANDDDDELVELQQVTLSSSMQELVSSAGLADICFRPSDSCFVHSVSPTRLALALKPNTRDDFLAAFPTTTTTTTTTSTSLVALRALTLRFYTLAKKADSIDILLILLGYILMHTTFYLLITRSYALGSTFFLPLAILSSALLALLLALPIAMALDIPIDPVALSEALPFLVCTVGFDKPLRLARAVFHHPHLELPPSLAPPTTPHPSSGYPILASPSSPQPQQLSSTLLKPSPKIITESLSYVYKPIIRDYILEIAVLTVGAYSRVGGLKEVCALAALILAVDCLLICTYLAAILGVMVEVRRIQRQRQKTKSSLQPSSPSSRSSSFTNLSLLSMSATSSTATATAILKPSHSRKAVPPNDSTKKSEPQSLYERLFTRTCNFGLDLNLMGWRIKLGGAKSKDSGNGKRKEKENPVARLKLLLIASFLTLHILNFITPLTPSKHSHSHSTSHLSHYPHGYGSPYGSPPALPIQRKVDLTSPAVRGVLNALAQALQERRHSEPRSRRDVYVKVLPVVHVRVPSATRPSYSHSVGRLIGSIFFNRNRPFSMAGSLGLLSKGHHHQETQQGQEGQVELEQQRQISLTDPVLSKWLLLMLGLSVLLNGYLLKGIAAGFVGGVGVGVEEGTKAAAYDRERGVRFLEVPLDVEEKEVRKRVVVDEEEEENEATKERSSTSVATQTLTQTMTTPALLPTPKASPLSTSALSITTTATTIRSLSTLVTHFNAAARPLAPFLATLNDEELILLVQNGKVAVYDLEKVLSSGIELLGGDGNEDEDEEMKNLQMKAEALERAVRVRRALISRASKTQTLEKSDIPLCNYDYSRVLGACCENVIGYIPLPLGIAGPLTIDKEAYPIPMATAEGTLVASTSRGCKALNLGGGVTTVITSDGMTRAPAVEFLDIKEAAKAKSWIDSEEGWGALKGAFESTSRFARLVGVKAVLAGRTLFVRFKTETGDAMGMNMISKGSEKALERMSEVFPSMRVLALSGNYCTDKKPAAVNWIEGRGKSVVAEAVVPHEVVKKVLKTTVNDMVRLGFKKNLVGSAMAGSVGGFNAHAANILTAVYLATGQDPAQNVESSQCLTLFEAIYPSSPPHSSEALGEPDLLVTVTMPCIEVGTVGGGTVLAPQQSVLEMLGLKGAHPTHPGKNAQRLARMIAAAVMAGELSLMAALASGELVRAHMRHNRSGVVTPAPTPMPNMPVEEKKKERLSLLVPLPPMLLTPASSTSSLPPFAQ